MATQVSPTRELASSPDTVKSELNEGVHGPLNASDSTIFAQNNVSLTLTEDSLIIRENKFLKNEKNDQKSSTSSSRSEIIGAPTTSDSAGSTTINAIPLYNILWAELKEPSLVIQYARRVKTVVQPATLTFDIESHNAIDAWVAKLLTQAYGTAQPEKRLRVLVNPKSGKGGALKTYIRDVAPLLTAAHCQLDYSTTSYQGEAIEIAEKMNIDAYDAVVVCSGDGLVHEIFNGFGKRTDAKKALSKMALAHIPCGSGNGMSYNLYGNKVSPNMAALGIVKGIRTSLDLVSVTQKGTRTLSFLSQAVGTIAEFDLATENLRWMGPIRFTYGYLVRIMQKKIFPCDLFVKLEMEDKDAIKAHYQKEFENKGLAISAEEKGHDVDAGNSTPIESHGLPPLQYGTVEDDMPGDWKKIPCEKLGSFYCANMAYMAGDVNYFPAALPNDGLMDLVVTDGDLPRIKGLKLLLAVGDGSFYRWPLVSYRKISAFRIIPKNQPDGYISIDGERVPFGPLQAEIHKGLGMVLSKSGHLYEAPGPK